MDALDQLALMLTSALETYPLDESLLSPPRKRPAVLIRHRGSRGGWSGRGQGVARALGQATVDPFGQRR